MPFQKDGETYLDTSEACQHSGVSRETLNNWVKAGRINRYKRVGRTSYYKESELDNATGVRKAEGQEPKGE
jgi:hypothetical protein